jgi:hypothetical protein
VAALGAEADPGDDKRMAVLPFALLNPVIRADAGLDYQLIALPRMPRDVSGDIPVRKEPNAREAVARYIAIVGSGDINLADEAEAGEGDCTPGAQLQDFGPDSRSLSAER